MVSLKETLVEFSSKRPDVFRYLVAQLNENRLWERLADTAVQKRLLRPTVMSKFRNSSNSALILINELMSLNCSVGLLVRCMSGPEFRQISSFLGVYDKIHVIKQPGDSTSHKVVIGGSELNLTFTVEGNPNPMYQWYHDGSPLKGETRSSFIISNFRKQTEGKYYCVAEQSTPNDEVVSLTSDPVHCILLPKVPQFIENLPPEIVCVENQPVKFHVKADESYEGSYEWVLYNRLFSGYNSNELVIRRASLYHSGEYRCIIKNAAGQTSSNICILKVEKSMGEPSAKIALLIGNSAYSNLSNLRTPSQDIKLLDSRLKEMGFHVVTVTDLTLSELQHLLLQFCSLIPKKSFVFFYFSGHGFEMFNNKFLLPVDCPQSGEYKMSNCICDQFIIKKIIERKPLLLVLVLDMCLKVPDSSTNPGIYKETVAHYDYDSTDTSIIQACATSDYQIAYESKSENNGLYCRCLFEHITRDIPAFENFQNAHADFYKKGKSKQKPQLTNNDQKKFRLCTELLDDIKSEQKFSEFSSFSPKSLTLHFRQIDLNICIIVKPHDNTVLNALDIWFMSDVSQLKFCLVCPELRYNYKHFDTLEPSRLPLRLTLNGIQKVEDQLTLHFRCIKYCIEENKNIHYFARFIIKCPPLLQKGSNAS